SPTGAGNADAVDASTTPVAPGTAPGTPRSTPQLTAITAAKEATPATSFQRITGSLAAGARTWTVWPPGARDKRVGTTGGSPALTACKKSCDELRETVGDEPFNTSLIIWYPSHCVCDSSVSGVTSHQAK